MTAYWRALRMWDVRVEGNDLVWFIAGMEFARKEMTGKMLKQIEAMESAG